MIDLNVRGRINAENERAGTYMSVVVRLWSANAIELQCRERSVKTFEPRLDIRWDSQIHRAVLDHVKCLQ
jgi:hypothetical protein